jgi:hypothetical protein
MGASPSEERKSESGVRSILQRSTLRGVAPTGLAPTGLANWPPFQTRKENRRQTESGVKIILQRFRTESAQFGNSKAGHEIVQT